jgi:hypothetical protein
VYPFPEASGGPGGAGQAGGLSASGGSLNISGSTIANNQATGGRGGDGGNATAESHPGDGGNGGDAQGGGLYTSGAMLSLTNVTISTSAVRGGDGGNGGQQSGATQGRGGDGGAALGGGIYVSSGTLVLTNSTVAANRAEASMGGFGYGGHPGPGQGGGVRNAAGTMNALNTLFGNSTATNHPDFSGNFGSASHNLLSDGTGSNLINGVNGNIVGSHDMPIDPLLGPLANNGGRTLTHALLPGSPAIDAGDNTGAAMWDQRGPHFYRIENGIIDIGAFEYRPPPQSEPLTEPLSSGVMGSRAHTSTTVWTSADLLPTRVQRTTRQDFVGARPARSEAASVVLRTVTRRADDVFFAGLGDPLASVLAS